MIKRCFTWLMLVLNFVFVFGQNEKKIDSLLSVLTHKKSDTATINIINKLSSEFMVTDINKSKKLSKIALDFAVKINNKKCISDTYNGLHLIYYSLYEIDSAKLYAIKAIKINENLENKKELATCYSNLANLLTETSDFNQAINYYEKAIKIDKQYKNQKGESAKLCNIGATFRMMGDFEKGLKFSLKSLDIAKKINNEKLMIANYVNIGILYQLTKNHLLAIKNYDEALKFAKKQNDINYEVEILTSYGQIFNEISDFQNNKIDSSTSKFQKGEMILKRALKLSKKVNNVDRISISYSALGTLYLNQIKSGNKDKKYLKLTKKYLDSNYNMVIKYKNERELPITLNTLADFYIEKKNFNKALQLNLLALSNAKDAEDYDIRLTIFEHLYVIYKEIKNNKNSLNYFENYVKLRDSMYGIDTQTTLIEQKVKFDFEKKSIKDSIANANQKIIASAKLSKEKNQKLAFGSFALLALAGVGFTYFLYRQKRKTNLQLTEINNKINRQNNTLKTLNTELIVSEEKLQYSNNSKEQLISMMSHDLLNPITAITNYNQQIIARKNNSDELLEAFKTVDAAIQPMHGLLDNMLQWTAIQKDGIKSKLKNQDINDIIKEIIGIYRPQAQLKFIKLIDVLDKDFILETDKSILSLIIRNLLNNAIKYSGNETEIEISSNTKNKTITIKDQGFGMTDEMINYLNTKQLDKIESRGTGLGLKLCYEFADAIGAKIVFGKNEKDGTSVDLKLQ